MADEPKVTNHAGEKPAAPKRQWFAQNSSTVIFLIIVIALVGAIRRSTFPFRFFLPRIFPAS